MNRPVKKPMENLNDPNKSEGNLKRLRELTRAIRYNREGKT
jgi:hypothetical protein